jgi:hypothetical protein
MVLRAYIKLLFYNLASEIVLKCKIWTVNSGTCYYRMEMHKHSVLLTGLLY